jgi:HEAT repeat protein
LRTNPRKLIPVLMLLVLALLPCLGCGDKTPPYKGKEVSELIAMLQDQDPTKQAQGALGLADKGPAGKAGVPSLQKVLKSPNVLVREQGARALGKIGEASREAVPDLIRCLEDPEWTVRRNAAWALGEIGAEARPAIPALKKLQNDPVQLVQEAVRQSLTRLERKP